MTDPTPPDAKCRHCRESRSAHSGRLDICPGNSWASSFEPVVRNEKCRKCGKAAIEHPPYLKRRPHIVDGQFQSDKYPACPPGKVPLSVKDPTAQDLLWEYAQRRRLVDLEFADDLEFALRETGYEGWAALDRVSLSAVERKYVELGRELREVREQLDEARRNEVLRAQERDEAIASGKVLVEANLRHFNTATENHNRAEALWNELVEVAAQAKEWERRFNWKADASNTELASVTTERDALRLGQKVVAERQREACAKAIERNWANPVSKVRRTPLVTDVPAAEREAEEEPPWAEDTRKVNEAVARRAAAMPGRCIHCGCTFETGQHQGYDMDHEFEPAVAMAREAIREENRMTTETEAGQQLPACPICGNAPTDHDPMADICYARAKGSVFPTVAQDPEMLPKLDDLSELMVLECDVPGYHRAKFSDLLAIIQRLTQEQRQALERVADEATKPFTFVEMLHTCSRLRAERDAADEGQKARIRELENLLKAITVERDAAVREGQARAITWAAKTMYDGAWSLQRGYHVKLSELADLVRSGNVTP